MLDAHMWSPMLCIYLWTAAPEKRHLNDDRHSLQGRRLDPMTLWLESYDPMTLWWAYFNPMTLWRRFFDPMTLCNFGITPYWKSHAIRIFFSFFHIFFNWIYVTVKDATTGQKGQRGSLSGRCSQRPDNDRTTNEQRPDNDRWNNLNIVFIIF